MIWPIMSYGSETWIYLKSVQNMINVFERLCYRRMLRISWTEHVTNEEVFNRANTKPEGHCYISKHFLQRGNNHTER